MTKASIVGGSGYAGGELLRLLLDHPQIELGQVTSRRFANQPVSLVHPNLRSRTRLTFSTLEELENCDVLFACLPNGRSMEVMGNLIDKAAYVIDCGADFRLRKSDDWHKWYGSRHAAPELLETFAYGLPELYRQQVASTRRVAGPGCEAAVSLLALWPLVAAGLIEPNSIIIDAKMSSSQAGSAVSPASHHPERSGAVRSYQPTGHRHVAEIEQALADEELRSAGSLTPTSAANVDRLVRVQVSATAIEMVRGLLVTIHTQSTAGTTEKDVWRVYRQAYGEKPFIRIVKQSQGLYRYPEPKILQGTNYCDLGFELDRDTNRLVLIGAIDNLVKGTAGNAVQCMNLMLGWDETTGLTFPGLHPI